jgi:hypothetical protein
MALLVKGKKMCGRRGKNETSIATAGTGYGGVLLVYHAGLADFNQGRFLCSVAVRKWLRL